MTKLLEKLVNYQDKDELINRINTLPLSAVRDIVGEVKTAIKWNDTLTYKDLCKYDVVLYYGLARLQRSKRG